MNKLVTILCSIYFLPFYCLGQETIKLSVKNELKGTTEEYAVLASDKTIKQGPYKKLNAKRKLIHSGFYKNDQKDSVWTYNSFDGGIEQQYDYSNNKLVYDKNIEVEKNNEFRVINGSDTSITKLDQPPLYIGGKVTMVDSYKLSYPNDAIDNEISGTVLISFVLDSTGKTSGHRVFNGIGYGCDEEALKVVKGIPDNWIPAKLHGQNVTVLVIHPIVFKINLGK